jgi:hypothetical protein
VASPNRFFPESGPSGGNWGFAARWSLNVMGNQTHTIQLSGRRPGSTIASDLNLRNANGAPQDRSAMNLELATVPLEEGWSFVHQIRRARANLGDNNTNTLTLGGLVTGDQVEFVRLAAPFAFSTTNTFTIGRRSAD